MEPFAAIWDAKSGREQRTLKHGKAAWLAVFTADGKHIASASFDSTVRLWEAKTGKATRTLAGHTKEVLAGPDGKLVASGGNDKTLRVHDAKTGKLLKELACGILFNVTVRPDGAQLAAACADGSIQIWPVRKP